MCREVVYTSNTVEVELEVIDAESVAIHIIPHTFNKAAYIEWLLFIGELTDSLRDRGIKYLVAPIHTGDGVTAKLAVRMGFTPVGYTSDGNAEIYLWELQQ